MNTSIKIRTPEELEPYRKQFRFKYKYGKIFVFNLKYNYVKAYSTEEPIYLKPDSGKQLIISKFVTSVWITRFNDRDIFDVQNAVAMASLNGYKKTDIDAVAKYL